MTKELNYLFSSGRLQSLSGRLQRGLFLIESPILIGAINHDIAMHWLTDIYIKSDIEIVTDCFWLALTWSPPH